MPRDNPRRINKRKLLKFSDQIAECKRISDELFRHELAIKALARDGLIYDPETGRILPKPRTDSEKDQRTQTYGSRTGSDCS